MDVDLTVDPFHEIIRCCLDVSLSLSLGRPYTPLWWCSFWHLWLSLFLLVNIWLPRWGGFFMRQHWQDMTLKVLSQDCYFEWISWKAPTSQSPASSFSSSSSVNPAEGRCFVFLPQLTIKQLLSSLLDSRQWTSQSHNASVVLQPNLCPWSEWISSGNPYLTLGFFLFMKVHGRKIIMDRIERGIYIWIMWKHLQNLYLEFTRDAVNKLQIYQPQGPPEGAIIPLVIFSSDVPTWSAQLVIH